MRKGDGLVDRLQLNCEDLVERVVLPKWTETSPADGPGVYPDGLVAPPS